MSVRIATFNAENLMHRFDFSGYRTQARRDPAVAMFDIEDEAQYRLLEQARAIAHTDDRMQLTSLAIADSRADIICLQEVESAEALASFEEGYLSAIAERRYSRQYLTKGNDGRGIDVALMVADESRDGDSIDVINIESHASHSFADMGLFNRDLEAMGVTDDSRIFRRDCMEVDLQIAGRALTLFVVHFKSLGPGKDGVDGRIWTMPIRRAEAAAVRKIIEDKFGAQYADRRRWLICGDLNDYCERIVVEGSRFDGFEFRYSCEGQAGFAPLLDDGFSIDLSQRRDPMDRWTLFYSGEDARHLCQLDYILASPTIAERNPMAIPDIIRNGQPWRTPFPPDQEVGRYPRIGWDRPKSSDHCPLAVTLNIL